MSIFKESWYLSMKDVTFPENAFRMSLWCIVYETESISTKVTISYPWTNHWGFASSVNNIWGEENLEHKKQWFHALGIWMVIRFLFAAITSDHVWNQGVCRAVCLSGDWRREPKPLPFQLDAIRASLVIAPPFSFKASNDGQLTPSHISLLWLPLLIPLSSFKNPCAYIGPTWVIVLF